MLGWQVTSQPDPGSSDIGGTSPDKIAASAARQAVSELTGIGNGIEDFNNDYNRQTDDTQDQIDTLLTQDRFADEDFAQDSTQETTNTLIQNNTDAEQRTVNQFDLKEVSIPTTTFAVSSDYPLSNLNDRWNFTSASRTHFGSGWDVSVQSGGEFWIRTRRRSQYNPGDKAEAGAAFCIPNGEIDGSESFRAGLIGENDAIAVGEDSGGEYVYVERDGNVDFKEYVDVGFEHCVVAQQDYSLYGSGEINWYFLEYRTGGNGSRQLVKEVTYAYSGNSTINEFNLPLRFEGNASASDDGFDVTLLSRKFAQPAHSFLPERIQTAYVESLAVDDSKWYEVATFKKDQPGVAVSITEIGIETVPCNVIAQVRIGTYPWNPSYGEFTFQEVADEENAVELSTTSDNVTRNGQLSGNNIGGIQVFSSGAKKNLVGSEQERVTAEIGEEPASVLLKATSGSSCTVQDITIATSQKR